MRAALLMVLAAMLEVAGDALIRLGLKNGGLFFMAAGAAALVTYGFLINLTALDFSRLMGIYIVVFFLVSQLTAVLVFHESIPLPVFLGGVLVIGGGLTMACWHRS